MMKQLLSLFVVALLCSCGTLKRYGMSRESRVLQTDANSVTGCVRMESVLSLGEMNMDEFLTVERFSAPDSCGKQYVTERATLKRTGRKQDQTLQCSANETVSQRDSSATERQIITAAEKTDTGIPVWLKVMAAIGGIAVLTFIVRIIIKFKVI